MPAAALAPASPSRASRPLFSTPSGSEYLQGWIWGNYLAELDRTVKRKAAQGLPVLGPIR